MKYRLVSLNLLGFLKGAPTALPRIGANVHHHIWDIVGRHLGDSEVGLAIPASTTRGTQPATHGSRALATLPLAARHSSRRPAFAASHRR